MIFSGIIYCSTNIINNKKYYGQTISGLKNRQRHHFKNAFKQNSKYYFHNALRKYGKENFTWKIIEEYENKNSKELTNKLNERELFWIINDKTYLSNYGYNMRIGPSNGFLNDDYKQKISISNKKWHENIGFSPETKEKMRLNHLGKKYTGEAIENYKRGNKGKNFGVKHSRESIIRASEKLKGRKISENIKIKIKIAAFNSRIECKYCHKIIALCVHNRCHGEKCKKKNLCC